MVARSNKEDKPESGPSGRSTMSLQEHPESPVADEDAIPGPLSIKGIDQSNGHLSTVCKQKKGRHSCCRLALKSRLPPIRNSCHPFLICGYESGMKEVGEATHKEAASPLVERKSVGNDINIF